MKDLDTPYLDALRRDGFVKVPSLLTPEFLSALRSASIHVTALARKGQWPSTRTVPKQFPPWPSGPPATEEGGIWGVQHLLHPEMPQRCVFASLYFSPNLLAIVEELLGINSKHASSDESQLVMELFNLLVSPSGGKDFELCWHRDDIKPNLSPEEEAKELAEKSPHGRQLHAQYNIALYDDDSLIVVPGSHRRPRTDVEREADPHATSLPGQVAVAMSAGDAVFYDSNILHRGVYKGIDPRSETGRMTLHGSVGLNGTGTARGRQVLQHGVGEWINEPGARFALPGRQGEMAEAMRQRLIDMGAGHDLGFSLEG